MAWTKEQEQAIHQRGTSIIVSAGAGSGKTAVLSERILDYCLNGNDIRQVLVLTFTKAAASEMKERIRSKLIKNNLDEQATLIDSAYITTFDAYSLALVKKYYYLLGVSKNVSVIDDVLEKNKINDIIDDLFNHLYESKDERFYALLEHYTSKDDSVLKSYLISIFNKLDLELDFKELYENYEANYASSSFYEMIQKEYLEMFNQDYSSFLNITNELKLEALLDPKLEKFCDVLISVLDSLETMHEYEKIVSYLANVKFPAKPSKASLELKELKDKQKDIFDKLKNNYITKYPSIDKVIEEVKSYKEDSLYILDLCRIIKDRLDSFKKELMCFSFMDIAKMAISLVKNNNSVRNELKYFYKEILIDEYQDTSDVQEAFISYIENNNLYMVGDIKQSIYRFRNANPYIFKNKYDSYAKNEGGIKIDLKANFRSRKEVLANINLLFNTLMTDKLGDANYKEEHQMNYGLKLYDSVEQDYDFNIECLNYLYDKDNEDIKQYNKAEIETFIIAKSIKDIINKKTLVFDKETGLFRKCDYNDFCILIDKSKEFGTVKKIFDYLNIPLTIEGSLDLNQSILPALFNNIFKVMLKIKESCFDIEYKHAYTAILRSFLFEYTDEKIFNILKLNKKNETFLLFYNLASLEDISYTDLFFKICFELKMYEKISLIGDTSNSLVVLNEIYTKLDFLNGIGYSFKELSDYFNKMVNMDTKLAYKPIQASQNCVRIMTIHASKGLEFPFCYFPLLSSRFNDSDSKAVVGFSRKYGIYLPFKDEGTSNTVVQLLAKKSILKEDLSEKVRLFYVALTRAREKLIIVSEKDDSSSEIKDFNNFNKMINMCMVYNCFAKEEDLSTLGLSLDYKKSSSKIAFVASQTIEYKDIPSRLEVVNRTKVSKTLEKLPDKSLKKNLETGTLLHSILENVDFKNIDIDSMPVDNYYKNIIKNVLKNDIFNNIKEAKVYKELEFYFDSNDSSYHGIIDMMALYIDHIDIIDYKLSNTSSSEYINQLLIYKEYVKTRYNLPINIYLLSLLKNEVKKINVD